MSKPRGPQPGEKNKYNQCDSRRNLSEIKLKRTDTTLDLSNIHALPRMRHKRSAPGVDAPHDRDLNFHFHYALGFSTQTLAGMLDSLVRVTRRVD